MNQGTELKRDYLRERVGWQLNVDALSDDEVRLMWQMVKMEERQLDAVRPLYPYNPDLITVTSVTGSYENER